MWSRSRRAVWWAASAACIVTLTAPVAFDRDSYPLSTYPMYSRARQRMVSMPVAVGIDATGAQHRLTLELIGDSDDPLIVASGLRQVIAEGRAAARCASIAKRLGPDAEGSGKPNPEEPVIVSVEIATERHDVVLRTLDEPSVQSRELHARCDVDGTP